jgi:hypothetical protein
MERKLQEERRRVVSGREGRELEHTGYQPRSSTWVAIHLCVRFRRFVSTHSTACAGVMESPRLRRWDAANPFESGKDTTLPLTMAVALIPPNIPEGSASRKTFCGASGFRVGPLNILWSEKSKSGKRGRLRVSE